MRVKVEYDTTMGIYGPHGIRTVRLPKYVGHDCSVEEYLRQWLKKNVCEGAELLQWWRDD